MSEEKSAVINKLDFKKYLNAYDFDIELPGNGETIKFKPITTGQLKRMLVYENTTNPMIIEKALDELITSSIVSDNFNINNLYLQDRFFLLLEIRKKTKGEMYKFNFTCPDCGSQSLQVINLDKLTVNKLPKDIDNKVKLNDDLTVTLKHITRGDQNLAYTEIKNIKKLTDNQKSTEMALLTHAVAIKTIITPEGEITDASIADKKILLENVPTSMYEKISKWFDDNNFGVEFEHEINCKNCEHSEKIDIPVENFFF